MRRIHSPSGQYNFFSRIESMKRSYEAGVRATMHTMGDALGPPFLSLEFAN